MKLLTQCHKIFIYVFVIALCVFISGSQSSAKKTVNYKNISKLKSKPVITLSSPLVTVTTPVQIKNLAPSWRDAQLIVESMVIFLSEDGPAGYSTGKVTKSNALVSGSYQGTVVVSANKVQGDVTNMYATLSVALARKGDQCKILGFGCHGIGSGGNTNCVSGDIFISDAVRPYTDPFLPGFAQSMQ